MEAKHEFPQILKDLIDREGLRRVCDIGGGANPILPLEFASSRNLDYTVLDILASELEKAPAGYKKIVGDIAAKDFHSDAEGQFDLVFSHMVAEHVTDGRQMHTNIFRLLAPGGYACHLFPTLYAFPFVVNRMFPETLTYKLLNLINPRDMFQHGKFPAWYSWCRGPSAGQLQRLESLGYEVVEYRGYFGHEGYYRWLPPVKLLHRMLWKFLVKHPVPLLTSFSCMMVRKPG
jgi:SAM-dependent methyltransferase